MIKIGIIKPQLIITDFKSASLKGVSLTKLGPPTKPANSAHIANEAKKDIGIMYIMCFEGLAPLNSSHFLPII